MKSHEKSIIPLIESIYHTFTPLEKTIADFFIHNRKEMDFSSKHIAKLLFVSEASLSRFAKKCNFNGYREFVYQYKQNFVPGRDKITSDFIQNVMNTYQELLNKSYALIDSAQMDRIAHLLTSKKRVYIYGVGSSGIAAQEIKLRFMRVGVNIEAITDSHVMKMNSVILDEDCFVIAISISGQTEEVIQSLKAAKQRGSSTLLMTSHKSKEFLSFCDELLLFAVKEHLESGKVISPQFPILVMTDILYAYYLQLDTLNKEALHDYTLSALGSEVKFTEKR